MCEQSIIGARASVMVYDDTQKKWVPSGTSSGLSKVQIYHHQQNNTFRVVGRKLQDHEVVINCSIVKGLKYNQATATFHQWRDSKYVYGLNFSSQQDAEAFARAMMHALEVLSGRVPPSNAPLPNGTTYDEDMGYRTMTREDAAIIQQQQITTAGPVPALNTPSSQSNQNLQQQQQSPPTPQTHHRTSSAPPAPQPPPMSMVPQGFGSPSGALPAQPPQYHPQMQQQQQSPGQHAYPSPGTYGSNQNMSQYTQPIYVSSSSNQAMNPQAVVHHAAAHNSNSPIYLPSNQASVLPNSVSNSSVYASQQQQQPQPPPAPVYGQPNGGPPNNGPTFAGNQPQFGQVPIPPPMQGGPPLAPPPPPMMKMNGPPQPPPPQQLQPPAPVAPPAPPMLPSVGGGGGGGAPPPPPPLPIGGLGGRCEGMDMSSLAAQLQQAKLKRNAKNSPPPAPAENSGSSTSSGGSGNYGTIGRSSTGMTSMMDEMAKTLARRRAQAEKKPEPEPNEENGRQRQWEKSNTLPHKLGGNSSSSSTIASSSNSNTVSNSGSESPRPSRKRFGSASEETILKQVNGGDGLSLANPQELDNFKADIIRELRMEITKAKQEILDAIKTEFNRR